MVRTWCVLYILTWKCASRQQLFISHLASWLRTRRFSEPTFRPSGATNHWKNTVFRDFPNLFAHLHLLSSDLFSSDSSHLCFSTVHIVGSFTSKLPSIIMYPHACCLQCIHMMSQFRPFPCESWLGHARSRMSNLIARKLQETYHQDSPRNQGMACIIIHIYVCVYIYYIYYIYIIYIYYDIY